MHFFAKRLETAKNFQILGRASEGDVAALNEKSRRLSSRERKKHLSHEKNLLLSIIPVV